MTDRPLLALTRRRAAPLGLSADTVGTNNMHQLIQLRWLAVMGQLVTILVVWLGLGVALPLPSLLAVIAVLILVNVGSLLLLRRHPISEVEMLFALLFDVGALTLQLLSTGGSTNPFTSLYLVQVVLGAILLRPASAWVLVVVASGCFAMLTLRPVPLTFPPGLLPAIGDLYTLGSGLGFALTCALLVLFISRISRNLHARDVFLAELRQHAAEEEHIVRMGLFASGAAHELGTPLASISVILGDWQRLPRVARDAELAGEVAEMQAEVQRCKTIVTDILQVAGSPRGETLGQTEAAALLDEIVDAWRGQHAAVPLFYARDALAGTALVADPALRQAIWNVLDNAAEASPAGLSLRATQVPAGLEIAVQDQGPGFPPDALDRLGQPYYSRKGAGHGVGLFLATNVTRRLGGWLEAANLPGGGARVSLVVPLVPLSSPSSGALT